MQTSSTHKYLRIAPRKVRLVAELIKGKKVGEAKAILQFTVKGATEPLQKALKSVLASAINNFQLEEGNLYVLKVVVNEGPKLKRYRPRARGRAFPIQKKTSHITIVLNEITPITTVAAKKPAKGPENIQAGPSQSGKADLGGKQKFRPERRDMVKPKSKSGVKRMFRRKAV